MPNAICPKNGTYLKERGFEKRTGRRKFRKINLISLKIESLNGNMPETVFRKGVNLEKECSVCKMFQYLKDPKNRKLFEANQWSVSVNNSKET